MGERKREGGDSNIYVIQLMTFIDCITTVTKVAVIEIPLAVLAVARDGPEAVRVPLRVSLPAAVGGEMGQRGTLGGADGVQTRDGRRNSNRANYRHYKLIEPGSRL